jgi:flagellar biosynthetic protein FliQ
MTPEIVMDLFREALMLIILIVSVLIVPSLIVGLIVSVFQAATQINEQTLSFLPRLLMTLIVLIVMGPYLLAKVMDFTIRIATNLPGILG